LACRTYQPLLQPGRHKLIGFARRSQGLLVAPGNPLGLQTLADVARGGARWANRPLGSGTRLLLDELMAQAALKPGDLRGWEHAEPSHSAMAQAVASGAADAGLGIETAARARGLDFVPLVEEDYYLVCLKSALAQPACLALQRTLQSGAWLARQAALPGYAPLDSGQVLRLNQRLPWWEFARAKGGRTR
jgi:molybdate-binding protein